MLSRGAIDRVLVVIATTALGASSCRTKVQQASVDATADASTLADAADLAAATSPSASAPAPSASTPRPIFEGVAIEPASFAGTFRCFKGMTLVQSGRIVTSTMHTNGTIDTIVACTVRGDDCVGTVREVETVRGKAPKVNHTKPVTLHRMPSGDILFRIDKPETSGGGGARESKPAAGGGTLCARR
jgi:hypothetical protein